MHRYAGHLADFLIHKRVERRAGDSQVVANNNGELVDLHLQLLARATHQNTLLLQRANKLQDAADIVNGGAADLLARLHHDLRADTVAREELLQQRAIFLVANQMAAAHAAAAGLHRAAQEAHRAGKVVAVALHLVDARLRVVREQLRDNGAVAAGHALLGAEADHLLRLQLNRQLGGDLFRRQIKTLAGHGDRHRTEQHNRIVIQLPMNRLFVDAANAPAVAIVDAVVHAQRLRDNKVAADHVDMRALQRRVIQAH